MLTMESLDDFMTCLDIALAEKRRHAEVKTGSDVVFTSLNKVLMKHFDIFKHFRDIIFSNHEVDKWKVNE